MTVTGGRVRATGYLRVSKERDGMEAPDIYRDDIAAYARYKGHTLVKLSGQESPGIWGDIDYSGRKDKWHKRPGFAAMMEAAERRDFDQLIVPKLSRFGRSAKDNLAAYDKLESWGVNIAFLDLQIDTSTSGGRFVRAIMTALVEYESDLHADVWKRNLQQIKSQGRPHGGGNTPYGYEYDKDRDRSDPYYKQQAVNPEEAQVVREIFARYVAGASLRSIARDLNDRKVGAPRGGPWRSRTLGQMLLHPAYIAMAWPDGDRKNPDELLPMAWEPLVDRDVWDKARALRTAQRAEATDNGHGGRAPQYLLSGFAECGACGKTLCRAGRKKSGSSSTYICPSSLRGEGCHGGSIDQARAEAEVYDLWWWVASTGEVTRTPRAKSSTADLDRRIAKIEREQAKLAARMGTVPDSMVPALSARWEALDADKIAVEQQRAVLAARDIEQEQRQAARAWMYAHDPAELWDARNTDERRDLLRQVFSKIVMVPGTRPKELRFEIHEDWQTPELKRVLARREQTWEKLQKQAQRGGAKVSFEDIREIARAGWADGLLKRAADRLERSTS
jgi:site-specific DNA recombinase